MTGDQGDAVCLQNNADQEKVTNAVQHSPEKEARADNDRALYLRRRILDVFDG